MNTNADFLTLAQWLSPAFPVGAFAYSHGVETAIQDGSIGCADDLETWLMDVIRFGSGRNDCILLRMAFACQSPTRLSEINQTAIAISASQERVLETQLQGCAFNQTVVSVWGGDEVDLCYPVAVGHAAAFRRLDVDLTAALYLHAFVSNLVSAAVRAVPLGQTEGQRTLAALAPVCEQVASETIDATFDDLSSTAFLSDIAAMQHETLQPRIFRS